MLKGAGMKVKKIDHVGIAVREKEAAVRFFTEVLGGRKILDDSWEFDGQEFNWAYFLIGQEGLIELISSPDPDSFINKFIEKRGEGLHHITVQVESLEEAMDFLKEKGINVVDVNTSDLHWKEAYIRPRDAFGVLIQLAEFDEEYWASQIL